MDFNLILYAVTVVFFFGYLIHAAIAKNFWSRIESLLWANLFLVNISAEHIVGILK